MSVITESDTTTAKRDELARIRTVNACPSCRWEGVWRLPCDACGFCPVGAVPGKQGEEAA